MIVWIDAQLSPHLAPWITERFGVETWSVQRLGYRDASDDVIFEAAREAGAIVMTKDADFIRLLEVHGAPPQVVLVTLGNTSNAHIRRALERTFQDALEILKTGEPLVEVGDITP